MSYLTNGVLWFLDAIKAKTDAIPDEIGDVANWNEDAIDITMD